MGYVYKWQEYFPIDCDCPLQGAQSQEIKVYRYVNFNPPREEDFKAYCILYPNRKYYTLEEEAKSCGLSVYKDIKDLKEMKPRVPGVRKRLIAEGKLDIHSGVVLDTPNKNDSHMTWWVYKNVKPETMFNVV